MEVWSSGNGGSTASTDTVVFRVWVHGLNSARERGNPREEGEEAVRGTLSTPSWLGEVARERERPGERHGRVGGTGGEDDRVGFAGSPLDFYFSFYSGPFSYFLFCFLNKTGSKIVI